MRPRPPRWIAPPRVIDGQLRVRRRARFDKERHFYLLVHRYAISRANALLSSDNPRGVLRPGVYEGW